MKHIADCVPLLEAAALESLVLEMKALRGAPPKTDAEKLREQTAELKRAYCKIGQLKKALREIEISREATIRCLQGEIRNLKNGGKRYPMPGRSWQEIRRLRKLAFCALCASEGVPYSAPFSVNDLRRTVWETYVLTMNIGARVQCCHCGKLLTFEAFTVEHLKPKTLGGTDDMSNLRPACELCNCTRPVEDISHRFA